MKRWLKLGIKVIVGAVALIVLLWLGIALYINMHKKDLLKEITAQLSDGINGTLTIESMKPELIRGFPGISVSLKNVVLRDSLYTEHHHNLLEAENVYVSINAFSILRHAPRIMNVEINTGKIFMFTDSTGYSNTSIFRKADNVDTSARKIKPHIDHIVLRNVDFTFENDHKLKLFHLDIHNMASVFYYNDTGWTATVNASAFVKSFAFNTDRGSYMKNKELMMHITLGYNKPDHVLSIQEQPIRIGTENISIGGRFCFSKMPVAFKLNISAQNILFKNAKDLLTPFTAAKLDIVDLKKPFAISADIDGHMKFRDTPLVHIAWTVKNNILVTPVGEVSNCSFTGMLVNQVDTAAGHTNDNSKISLYNLKGTYEQIPFSADTIRATNLVRPVIEGRFVSTFPLIRLNSIIGGNTFAFNGGDVDLNLLYKGGIMADDTTASYVYGSMEVSKASMTYLPRHLSFINTSAQIAFNGGDVFIENAKVQSGTSILLMNGSMRNFLNLYYNDPAKIVIDWHIRSSQIDLGQFRNFLTTRQSKLTTDSSAVKSKSTGMTRASRQLDKVLDASNVHMRLQVDKLLYKDFTADKIDADIQLAQAGITLNNISVNNAGGRLVLHGNIDQRGPVNNFHVVSAITDVHISEFFHSFRNFGQSAITDKNLHGQLYADVDVTGSIRDNGDIVPNSFDGTVSFDIHNGSLVNFGPLLKIGKYVFRNRDLANVTFSELKNSMDIKGDKIIIKPMLIESSAINLKIRGVYSLSKGTDIDIDVPLRNPKKDELALDDGLKEARDMKGIIVHLKAVDGDDGNVKIRLMMGKQDSTNTVPGKKTMGRRILDKLHR